MSLVSLECERCSFVTTHQRCFHDEEEYVSVRQHSQNPCDGVWYYCRQCERGRSPADIPDEGIDVVAKSAVETPVEFQLTPNDVAEGETIDEAVERKVREEYLETIVDSVVTEVTEEDVFVRGQSVESDTFPATD